MSVLLLFLEIIKIQCYSTLPCGLQGSLNFTVSFYRHYCNVRVRQRTLDTSHSDFDKLTLFS